MTLPIYPAHLVVVTDNYPSPAKPACGTFVRAFAHAVARQGVVCTVIQPVPIHHTFCGNGYPYRGQEEAGDGRLVTVYRPRYCSLSARGSWVRLGVANPSRFTLRQFTDAVYQTIRKQDIRPDALYGHFLYLAGVAAIRVGKALGLPSFPCAGESSFWTVAPFGDKRAATEVAEATGILTNSSPLKRMIAARLGFPSHRMSCFPNGIDRTRFKPHDKPASRIQLGLPQNLFLTAFVGSYSARKGVERVNTALTGLTRTGGLFAGQGALQPHGAHVLLNRPLTHEQIPVMLSAADVFVLPTLAEGSCNAIVEAMACGLPVISSKGEFNDDILDDHASLRIDPLDVPAIRDAIIRLRDDPALCARMSDSALRHSALFDINDRARRMLSFMKSFHESSKPSEPIPGKKEALNELR